MFFIQFNFKTGVAVVDATCITTTTEGSAYCQATSSNKFTKLSMCNMIFKIKNEVAQDF